MITASEAASKNHRLLKKLAGIPISQRNFKLGYVV